MKKNNLISLLESFDKKELTRFHQFISSPYFNVDTRLPHLFTLLKKQVLHKNSFDENQQTQIYKAVFADIDTVKATINPKQKKLLGVRMSLLGKLAKRFLMVEGLAEDPSCEIKLLNKKLFNKQQFPLLEQFNNIHAKRLDKHTIKDLEYYTQILQLELGKMQYFSTKDVYLKEDNLEYLSQNLDLYYLISKLHLQIMMKSLMRNLPIKQYNVSTFSPSLLEITPYKDNILVSLYLTSIELIDSNEESNYQRLLQLLEQHSEKIAKTDLIGLYTVASNYCSLQSRKKEQLKYVEESLRLYKIMSQKNLLVEGKTVQIGKLLNLVNLSCKVGDFEWAFDVVNKYYHFIPKNKQESTKSLLLGIIYFNQGQYETTLDHLMKVKELDAIYEVIARTLRIRSTYELDKEYSIYTMQLFLSTQSFFRNKKEIPKIRKKSYENFTHLLMNLYKLRHQQGKMTLAKIKTKMEQMELISHKKWLIEKMKTFQK